MRTTLLGLLLTLVWLAACGPRVVAPKANGEGCADDAQCQSGHCVQSYCSQCADNADCAAGFLCGKTPRYLGASGGPYCVSADAGCASAADQCPSGFSCTTCATGFACQDTTGECYSTAPPPPPVCGKTDFSNGWDAGWGPPPNVSGSTCYTCIGCPFGSSCVCGVSGVVGGLRCDNLGSGLACFATGGVGTCRSFPDDCASNAQCTNVPDSGVPAPFCSRAGRCTQCLRDVDCPLRPDGGPSGCIDGKCSRCCGSNADCPSAGPLCVAGFCYPCAAFDGGCASRDAGTDAGALDGGTSDAGLSDGGDGG